MLDSKVAGGVEKKFFVNAYGEVKSTVDLDGTKTKLHESRCCLGDCGRCDHFWKAQVAYMVESTTDSKVEGALDRYNANCSRQCRTSGDVYEHADEGATLRRSGTRATSPALRRHLPRRQHDRSHLRPKHSHATARPLDLSSPAPRLAYLQAPVRDRLS